MNCLQKLLWIGGWSLVLSTNSHVAAEVGRRNVEVTRFSIDLSGEWEFRVDPLDVGREQHWFDATVPFLGKMRVPGAWNVMGAAYPTEELLRDYENRFLNGRSLLGPERESEKLFHVYPGPAWYRKTVTIPAEWKGRIPWLVIGGVHREAEVWINGNLAGGHHSYLTPFRINLSSQARQGEGITIAVRVDARRRKELDPLMGCLDTLDFLYISWGGLHRKVTLEATPPTWIDDVFVIPKVAAETAEVRFTVSGEKADNLTATVDLLDAAGSTVASKQGAAAGTGTETVIAAPVPNTKLWSPKAPHLYTAQVRLLSNGEVIDIRSVRFGMREFAVVNGKFVLNGKPIFLRGYGDDCIFPNTICPPAEKPELQRRLLLAREYGFNYVRHHSWIPTEEYLDAADELGMMIQPEFPLAYRWDLPATEEAKRSALQQWQDVIRLHRNHPSIVTWCMGNEQYDSFPQAAEMYAAAKRLDPTRPVIDSDGCGFKHQDRKTLDFMVVQFGEGDSIGFQDGKYSIPETITKPVVAHEMGYFVTLPDLSQLTQFESGLRPYWLLDTRALASRRGVLDLYPEWLASSYRLQALSLKCNLEAARRSRLSGTSVWLFQDYPNCAEGVVDMFLRPKSLSAKEFRKFNAPTVLLLEAPRRSWWGGEIADLKLLVSRFEDDPSEKARLRWELRSGPDRVGGDVLDGLQVRNEGVQDLVPLRLSIPKAARAARLTFSAELADANGTTQNSWDLWVFPNRRPVDAPAKVRIRGLEALRRMYPSALVETPHPTPADTDLLLTSEFGEETLVYLRAGGRVVLLDPEPTFPVEKTNFRLSSWDGGGPSGTILDQNHPALRDMGLEGWCDLQFYHLIQNSKSVSLEALPTKVQPLVRCIDRPTRLADRAYLFEVSVGPGKLLVSGFNFARACELKDPAGIHFLDCLIAYAAGPEFAPKVSLPEPVLRK